MLLPALSKAKERARRIVCVKNLNQLALGTIMYADDHGDWPDGVNSVLGYLYYAGNEVFNP